MNCDSCDDRRTRAPPPPRLGVDQVLRHDRVDLDRAHALLDRALHAQQADAILVLHQLADPNGRAVAEMVDVVDLAATVAQVDQRLDHAMMSRDAGCAWCRRVEIEAHVHLDAARPPVPTTAAVYRCYKQLRLNLPDRSR